MMKRRTFIQFIGAGGTLVLGGLGEPVACCAKTGNPNRSVQALIPVFERLPDAMRRADQRNLPASVAFSTVEHGDFGFDLEWDQADSDSYPLVMGLGPRAERVLDAIAAAGNIPITAGLYRTGHRLQQEAPNWLARRLQKTAAVVLLIDPDDSSARDDARAWARYLKEAEIDLRVALVLEAQDPDAQPSWRSELGLTVIDVCSDNSGLETTTIVRAMLPCLLFQQISLIGVDHADLCTVIASGSQAWTTAIHVLAPDDCATALARAFANLPHLKPTGLMVWVTSGRDYSLLEFDAVVEALHQRTDDGIPCVHAPSFNDDYIEGERLLSLTLFSRTQQRSGGDRR